MALQFRSAARRSSARSGAERGGTAMVWNRPPLNHGMSSTPYKPPLCMVPKSCERPCVSRSGVACWLLSNRSNMRPGSRPTSSAKKQNRHCVRKCATWLARCCWCCGSVAPSPGALPRWRRPSARAAKLRAAASVMSRFVCRGLKLSGAVQMRRSSARLAGWSISAMRTSCVALGWPVNWVWMRMLSRSDTTRMGGLERARL